LAWNILHVSIGFDLALTAVYGYARVSSTDQDFTLQRSALKAAGCQRDPVREGVRHEPQRPDRARIAARLLAPGDTLVVTRIDRLARSMRDLQNIVHELREKGAYLKATEQPVDTSTAAGKAFLDMLGVFAEFETNLRRERQLEGIAAAKAKGVYKGRPKTIDVSQVKSLLESGVGPTAVAKRLGNGRASVYRLASR
jgi:DNA invertase Pin-like site-specific DNA recombinase